MSLIDADKNNVQRKAQSVNAPDTVINRMAHNTMSNTYRSSGSEVVAGMSWKQALQLTNDSENRYSSAFGYIPELSAIPVLIIAREGFDVFSDILEIDPP